MERLRKIGLPELTGYEEIDLNAEERAALDASIRKLVARSPQAEKDLLDYVALWDCSWRLALLPLAVLVVVCKRVIGSDAADSASDWLERYFPAGRKGVPPDRSSRAKVVAPSRPRSRPRKQPQS